MPKRVLVHGLFRQCIGHRVAHDPPPSAHADPREGRRRERSGGMSDRASPATARPVPKVAHRTSEPRPEIELARIQGVEILADDGEKSCEVSLRAGRVRVELDLRRPGLD